MDYFPRPGNALPGVSVPLLEIIPLYARPKSDLPFDLDEATLRPPESHQQAGDVKSKRVTFHERTTDFDGLCTTQPTIQERTTSWGEHIYLDPILEQAQTSAQWPLSPEDDNDNMHGTTLRDPEHDSGNDGESDTDSDRSREQPPQFQVWIQFAERFRLISKSHDCLNVSHPPARMASLFQSWAFFGLLELLFQERIDAREWRRRGTPSQTSQFVQWPDHMIAKLHKKTQLDLEDVVPHVTDAASIVSDVCTVIEAEPVAMVEPYAQILLSVRLLCSALLAPRSDGKAARSRYLLQQMQARNWCPSTIVRVMDRSDKGLEAAYYLYTVLTARNQDLDHSSCPEQFCKAANTSLDHRYESLHVTPDCNCEMMGVSTAEVCAIIERGKVPLVQLVEKDSNVMLAVVEATPRDEYTAVSHVWSDGLGNPRENALPRCQVQRLFMLIQRRKSRGWRVTPKDASLPHGIVRLIPGLYKFDIAKGQVLSARRRQKGSRLMWMDTFCIPVSTLANDDRILRLKLDAINRMNFIYAAANHVMVLDRELLSMRIGNISLLEAYARIAVSPWTGRCWTYQEGALATTCYFEYANASIDTTIWTMEEFRPLDLLHMIEHKKEITSMWWFLRKDHAEPGAIPFYNPDRMEQWTSTGLQASLFSAFHAMVTTSTSGSAYYNEEIAASNGMLQDTSSLSLLNVFVATWNELAYRTTSLPSDVDLIFANMLNYPLFQLTDGSLPKNQRFQAMLWNMSLLPLAILFNSGPKVDSAGNHHNRWVPASPSDMLIHASDENQANQQFEGDKYVPLMRLHNDSLWTRAECAPDTAIVLVSTSMLQHGTTYLAWSDTQVLKVDCLRISEIDQLDTSGYDTVLFMISRIYQFAENTGARLYLVAKEEEESSSWDVIEGWGGIQRAWYKTQKPLLTSSIKLTAVYDCPIQFQLIPVNAVPADATVLDADQSTWLTYPKAAWKLRVICDSFNGAPKLVVRPFRGGQTSSAQRLDDFGWIDWPLSALWVAIYVVPRIIIAVQLGWNGTNLLYKVSTVLFVCLPIPPIPEATLLSSRIQDGNVRPIDIVWAVLSISITWLLLIYQACYWYFNTFMYYRIWARSYDEDWPACQTTWQYRLAFGDLSVALRYFTTRMRLWVHFTWYFVGHFWWKALLNIVLGREQFDLEDPYGDILPFRRLSFESPDDDSSMSSEMPVSCVSCRRICRKDAYECVLCNDFYCVKCVKSALDCRDAKHWKLYRLMAWTLDKYGWLLEGWKSRVDADGKTSYVEKFTGVVSELRPRFAGFNERMGPMHLYIDRNRLCLAANREEEAVVMWNLATSEA